MDAQPSLRKRGRDLEANEARPHDHGPLRALRPLDNRFAVTKGAEVMDVRQGRPRDVEADRSRPSGQEHRFVRERASILEQNLSLLGIDGLHARPELEIDARVPIPVR